MDWQLTVAFVLIAANSFASYMGTKELRERIERLESIISEYESRR